VRVNAPIASVAPPIRIGNKLVRKAFYASLFCSLLCSVALTRAQAQQEPQVRVEMSADRNQLSANENVTIRVYVQTHGAGQPDIEVPEFEGFQIVQRAVQRPMQFSFGFGNSQPTVTSTTQYTFVLAPMGPGTFKIPPVKVSLGQRVFTSKSLALTVTGQAAQPNQQQAAPDDVQQQPAGPTGQPRQYPLGGGTIQQQQQAPTESAQTPAPQASGDVAVFDNEAFLRTVVDKVEPYEGEQVTATIYLYTRHNLQQVPAVQTEASTDGFWVQDLLSATRSLEPTRQVIKGRGYWVYVLRRFALFPLRSGELTIGSMALTLTRDGIFDLFDPTRGPAALDRKSVPVLVRVKPLPTENKPAGQIAVGSFEIKTALDRAQVATGDAVTLTATIRGTGHLGALKLPDPNVKGLQVLQPESHDLTESPKDRVFSTRTFAWLIVPKAPGNYQLPAISVDTFDPATGAYKRISSESLTLTAAGSAPAGSVDLKAEEPEAEEPSGDEPGLAWPPLRTRTELARPKPALASHAYYPILLLIFPLLWLFVAFGPSTVARLRARGSGGAEQIALKNAQRRLGDAQKALKNQDGKRFHADVAAALNAAVEARLGENVTGLTQHQLRSILGERGMPAQLTHQLGEVLAQCDFARFSSASVSEPDMQRLLAQAEQLWSEVASFTPDRMKESA
jgi:hypothetical protein